VLQETVAGGFGHSVAVLRVLKHLVDCVGQRRVIFGLHQEPCSRMVDQFRHTTCTGGYDRRPYGHSLQNHPSESFCPLSSRRRDDNRWDNQDIELFDQSVRIRPEPEEVDDV
jgi:hypothetical protein